MRTADTDADRTPLALAVAALVIDVVRPLLPIYGDGHQFVWSQHFPARYVIGFLIASWAVGAAVVVGLLVHRLGPRAVAAGMFAAAGLVAIVGVVAGVVQTPGFYRHSQTVLSLGLETIEAAALGAAAWMWMAEPVEAPAA